MDNETLIEMQMQKQKQASAKSNDAPASTELKQDNGNKSAPPAMADLLATGSHTKEQPFSGANATGEGTQGAQQNNGSNASAFASGSGTGGTTAGKLIGGELAVNLLDLLVPSLFVFVAGRVGYLIIKKDIQLSAREKESLFPAMQAVLDRMVIDLNNPYANLALVMGVVYGSKLMDVIPNAKKMDKKTKDEKEADKAKDDARLAASIEKDEELTNEQKFEAELSLLVDKDKKVSRRTREYILNKFTKDGTIAKLKNKYKLK